MSVSIRIDGGRAMRAALSDMADDVREAVALQVQTSAADLEADIKLRIQQGPKSGRIYKRGNTVHRASAPGEAPASDTGTLIGSIYNERETDLTYTVGSRLAYAAYLEYGTARMMFAGGVGGPRPFFRPAVEDMRDVFRQRLEAAISRVVK